MPPSSNDLAVLDQLAEEFVSKLRRGERPPIQPYADKHPALAADINRLFPTLVAVERLGAPTDPIGNVDHFAILPSRIGEYRILRQLGEGGMGIVYEAVQESLGRHVALKVLPTHGLMSDRFRERFKREARAAARLHHPHIVPVFGTGEDRGTHFYAMQYIPGRGLDAISTPPPGPAPAYRSQTVTLVASDDTDLAHTDAAARLHAEPKTDADHFQWVARIGAEVAEALAYAHEEGVIHRDVKPSNLLVDDRGHVWVTDFGLAKTTESDGLTASGDIVGTIRYMAPERFNGWSDARSDVYGLGATLYELLAGRPMFDDPDRSKLIHAILHTDPARPRKLNRAVPHDLETIVLKSTAREPGHRYGSAQAMAEDLRRFLSGMPIHARRHSWAGYALRICRRRPLATAMTATLAVLLLVLLVGSLIVNVRLDDQNRQIVDTQNALAIQLGETDEARTRESEARNEARRQLILSLKREREAARGNPRPGSRGEGLEAVRQFMLLSREFPLSPEETQDLRNVVIATCAQMDVVPELAAGPALPGQCSFSPDLKHYVARTAKPDRSLRVHEYPSGRLVAQMKTVDDAACVFSRDGRYLVVRDGRRALNLSPHTLVIWEWRDDKLRAEIPGDFDGKPWSISPDSTELALSHVRGTVAFHSLADGQKLRSVPVPTRYHMIEFHPDGKSIAVLPSGSNRIEIRDVADGKIRRSLVGPPGSLLMGFGWSADGKMIAAGAANYRAYVWHVENGQLACDLFGHQAQTTNCIFDPNGQWVATTAWDNTTRFWDPVTGSPLLNRLMGTMMTVSADGQRIGYQANHVSGVWSATVAREFRTLHGHVGDKGPWQASFGLNGQILATSNRDAIRFWEARTGRAVGELRPPAGALTTLFTSDGKYLFAVGHEHCTRWPTTYDAESNTLVIGRPQALLPDQTGTTERRASLSADGKRAAIYNQNRGLIYVFPLEDPSLLRTFGPMSQLGNVHLSPDGRWVIGTSWPAPAARAWDTLTRQLVMNFPTQRPAGFAFSPDGEHVVVGSVLKGEVRKVRTWEHVCDIPGNNDGPAIVHAAYSPDGRILAVCRSSQRDVHLLDSQTFKEFARLEAPDPQPVHSLAFSPDGSRLVVNCGTRVVQMWDLRAIRERLSALGLDWDHPPYEPETVVEKPLRVVVEGEGK